MEEWPHGPRHNMRKFLHIFRLQINKSFLKASDSSSLFLVFRLWSISLSVPKTLSTFPYLSPRPGSLSSRPSCSMLGTAPKTLRAASPASPPRCPLPLLSLHIRTRPARAALSSEANTNQPQMFILGEKGQQMQSHSIKLASLPLCLCVPLFPDFLHRSLFLRGCKEPRGAL